MSSATQPSTGDRVRQILTIAAIVATLAINLLSNFFPLNGLNIGQISNTLFADVKIIPANYAFAIWGLIYIGLIAWGVHQLQPSQQRNPDFQRTGYWLVVACLAQILWVYLFLSRLFWPSVLAMLGILIPLVVMYLRLDIGRRRVSRREQWLVQAPISVYLGWISVATVVNVASALDNVGWNGWGLDAQTWTIVMILVSAAIGALVAWQRHDRAFPLVIVWALVAIAVRQINTLPLAIVAGLAAIGLLGLVARTKNRTASN